MSFEVPIEALPERRRWPVPVVVVLAAAIVGIAAATGGGTTGRVPADETIAVAAESSAPGVVTENVAVEPPTPAPPAPRAVPADLDCRDLDEATCLRLAKAAVRVLPAEVPTVRGATVWRSMFCGDGLDCPQHYLEDGVPLGSVIVTFVDHSPQAAINVVDWRYSPSIRLGTRAWVARWLPEAG